MAETLPHVAGHREVRDPDDLARAAVADLLGAKDDDFRAAAERVIKKIEELYRRLA